MNSANRKVPYHGEEEEPEGGAIAVELGYDQQLNEKFGMLYAISDVSRSLITCIQVLCL